MSSHEEVPQRYRKLKGTSLAIWRTLLISIPVTGIIYILNLYEYFNLVLFQEQYTGLFLGLILASIFIGVPFRPTLHTNKVPLYDWVLSLAGLTVGLYITFFYPDIVVNFAYVSGGRFFLSVIAIVLILEALRRILGWTLVILVSTFLAYSFLTSYFPGPLEGDRIPTAQMANYLYLDTNSLMYMLNIAASVALAFILFGQILLKFGGADIFNNFAVSLFGKYRGGPAKAAVIGSSLTGSVSGGPVSNVMLTGNITIPLMIRNGYTRREAGAIESVASTGGIIMPPVMGVAAFLIAENLGVPYVQVMLAAIIPAVLYYLCLLVQVDLKAAKKGLKGIPKKDIPNFKTVIKTGWIIIPIFAILLYFLFILKYTPTTSGVYASFVAMIFLLILKESRIDFFKKLINTLFETGKSLMEIGIVLAAAGLVIGIIGVTGLGFNLAMVLTQIGESNLVLLLISSAVVSLILGMGMPAVAAYSLVATLVAPALTQLGIHPLAAHMFVFYFSSISSFTPPIAVASFAAATIAKANPNQVSFSAMKLGIVALIVPFVFVYTPDLLIGVGDNISAFLRIGTIATAILGVIILSISLEGFLFKKINVVTRFFFVTSAILLLIPITAHNELTWASNVIGLLLFMFLFVREWKNKSKPPKEKEGFLPEVSKV